MMFLHFMLCKKPVMIQCSWRCCCNIAVYMCRAAFLHEMAADRGDPVLAALQLAAEDDAVNTKSTVALPVAAFSKRQDKLVDGIASAHQEFSSHEAALSYVRDSLFGRMGFRVAQKKLELYSPYRIYMHKVLTQRCGTPEALAVLLAALVQRAQARELIPQFDIELGLPAAPGQLPAARVAQGVGQSQDADLDVRCARAYTTLHLM